MRSTCSPRSTPTDSVWLAQAVDVVRRRVVLRQLDGVALPPTLNLSSGASVAPRGTLEMGPRRRFGTPGTTYREGLVAVQIQLARVIEEPVPLGRRGIRSWPCAAASSFFRSRDVNAPVTLC